MSGGLIITPQGFTNPMTTGGDVIYGGASGVATRLANGTAGQVLTSAGGTAAPTWAYPYGKFNMRNQTSNYNAVINDYIYCSSSAFTITLPDATTVGYAGQMIAIEHAGTNLVGYTLNTTSAQTITGPNGTVASGSYILFTNGEKVILVCDGSGWRVAMRETETQWIDQGAIGLSTLTATSAYVFTLASGASITAGTIYTNNGNSYFVSVTTSSSTTLTCSGTGTPSASGTLTFVSGSPSGNLTFNSKTVTGQPLIGTTAENHLIWKRNANFMECQIIIDQTGGGTSGSGDYIFYVPVLADTTFYTGYITTGTVLNLAAGTSLAAMSQCSGYTWNATTGSWGAMAWLYTAGSAAGAINAGFRFTALTAVPSGIMVGSASTALANAATQLNFSWRFPVSNWQP